MQDEIKRLVLADDHHLLRRGFRSLLGGEPGLEVVGEASTGLGAIEKMDGITATARSNATSPA
jgi:DNA-binding NarL/FixJ family response regulator